MRWQIFIVRGIQNLVLATCLLLFAGCISGRSGGRGDAQAEMDAQDTYGGALSAQGEVRTPLIDTNDAMGVSAVAQTGGDHAGPKAVQAQIGPGAVFYVYIALAAILLCYLFVLLRRRRRVVYEKVV